LFSYAYVFFVLFCSDQPSTSPSGAFGDTPRTSYEKETTTNEKQHGAPSKELKAFGKESETSSEKSTAKCRENLSPDKKLFVANIQHLMELNEETETKSTPLVTFSEKVETIPEETQTVSVKDSEKKTSKKLKKSTGLQKDSRAFKEDPESLKKQSTRESKTLTKSVVPKQPTKGFKTVTKSPVSKQNIKGSKAPPKSPGTKAMATKVSSKNNKAAASVKGM